MRCILDEPIITLVRNDRTDITSVTLTSSIRESIQMCFNRSYERMINSGSANESEAEFLRFATARCLRRTAYRFTPAMDLSLLGITLD